MEAMQEHTDENSIKFLKAISMILLPIIIIVFCSFVGELFAEGNAVRHWLDFFGDKILLC